MRDDPWLGRVVSLCFIHQMGLLIQITEASSSLQGPFERYPLQSSCVFPPIRINLESVFILKSLVLLYETSV